MKLESSPPCRSAFCRRAQLYAGFDNELAHHTRFFGAAALTNSVLNELLSSFVSRFAVSAAVNEFLCDVGSRLEAINVEGARRIAAGRLWVIDLDGTMVETEQAAVQSQLDRLRSNNPKWHADLVRELNEVLDPAGCRAWAGKLTGRGSWYIDVLRHVCGRLGRRICFERQEDRRFIGLSLIEQLRSTGTSARCSISSGIDMAIAGTARAAGPCGGDAR